MRLEPGLRVTDNVYLVRRLGDEGTGSVWLADHLALKTQVAVKLVAADGAEHDPLLLERFNREAALSARIKSPHVVQIFDHGVMEGGRPYVVMELLEGESLAARLDRTGTLSLGDTAAVVAQTAKALHRAHQLGIVHGDLAPAKLFLTQEDADDLFLKVLDFGIGRRADRHADVWALGVVAYRCLTGRSPFPSDTPDARREASARADFVAPCRLRPELPAAVDGWFARAFATDPAARFASAKELANGLVLLLTGAVDDSPSFPDGSGAQRAVVSHRAPAVASTAPSVEPRARSRRALVVALACVALVVAILVLALATAKVGGF
jgi:serine/threonine-protein kinase